MSASPRELVLQTLAFENPARAPRDLWTLPIAQTAFPEFVDELTETYPSDLAGVSGHQEIPSIGRGDMYAIGESVDEWGCTFVNIQAGVHGEVKEPLVGDWTADAGKVHIPRETLSIQPDAINRDCAASDQFTLSGCCPRPFEQLQFIRGTAELMMDLVDPAEAFLDFVRTMHEFYCESLELWVKTDIDGIRMMDDWGSQNALLISPRLWREHFKPLYSDYVDIAHGAGKKVFFHSDGYILDIYPELIEIGIDAVNSQIFCMGVENLEPFAGKITFWGEIDRQRLLPFASLDEIDAAVREVYNHLWRDGGCIAQCEFGPAGNPDNVRQVFKSWADVAGG